MEDKTKVESKKFGPMSVKERDKFNELENRIIKMETTFRTIGNIIKWVGVVAAAISTIIGTLIKLGIIKVG